MFTWGSKYLIAVSGVSLVGAVVYGIVTGGDPIGVVSMGYKGGVGDHVGYAILVTIGFMVGLLAVLDVMIRDGDASDSGALLSVEGVDGALNIATPRAPSYWGPLTAFGVACLAVGLAVSSAFFILGIVVLAVVMLEWLVTAWADRATGDPAVNSVIRNRVLGPLEVPMLSMLGIGVIVLGISRVLLATSEVGSTVVAAVVAALVFASAIAIAKSDAPRNIISGIVAIGAVAVLAGGIAGAVIGERDIAHHEEPGSHADDGAEGEGE